MIRRTLSWGNTWVARSICVRLYWKLSRTAFNVLTMASAELDYIAVRPEARNRGIASMLVESGIAQSETLGIEIFLLGFKAGLGVYKRLGFEMLEYNIQDDSKYGGKGEYGTYFLERKAKKEQ
jgi:GNAT superfamily N-acetyltransferase